MSKRWIVTVAAPLVLAAVAMTLLSCSSGQEVRTSADGVAEPTNAISIPDELAKGPVVVGSEGTTVLPVVRLGVGTDRGGVWLYDQASGAFEQSPRLPIEGWLGSSQAASDDRFVVVDSTDCSVSTVESETGYDCPEESPRRVILVLDRENRTWQKSVSPSSTLSNVSFIGRESVRLSGTDQTGKPAVWTLNLTDWSSSVVADEQPASCMSSTQPALKFDSAQGPATTATLTDVSGHEDRSVTLPEPVVPVGIGSKMACFSSGAFLGYPGDVAPIGTDIPPGLEPANRPGVTSTTVKPRGTAALTVYNLSVPRNAPVEIGDSTTVTTFVSGGSYLAVVDAAGLHLLLEGADTATMPAKGQIAQLVPLTGGPVLIGIDSNFGLKSFEQVAV